MRILLSFVCILISVLCSAQQSKSNPVYIDSKGILRWTSDNKEAVFFGVNYTVPFAYGYRSHKALGADLEKAIDADVYHMARLGLNAFRVHMWDVEITDSLGNLLENEHLRLFDYLLKRLKERNIKILLTPIAFWGNGYPEKDTRTIGFSTVYGKRNSVVLEAAFKAQENYLRQIFNHVNPYTKISYKNDPDIIAAEINNEPHHSGPRERTTEYINRMAAAIRSTGWTRPVFYNISESPTYAGAVVNARVDGYSFQWYPTGLVAGHERKGNFLPHVDEYRIPFKDSLKAFNHKPRMVYEFDAADVMQPIMYPAMARSYRTAGFQWATQFAYDPMTTAYGNTEYQTHYLNFAYTPSKAISILIAGEAFRKLPLNKDYGGYPADTLFDVFRVSYKEALSEMNSEDKFYYTGTTQSSPVNPSRLKHIAGTGSSRLIRYTGSGAYFLDQLEEGIWRFEIMPDAITIRDPLAKASPKKEVVRIQWMKQQVEINLADLGKEFEIKQINANGSDIKNDGGKFTVTPGVYLLERKGKRISKTFRQTGAIKINEFYAPQPFQSDIFLSHQPVSEISEGKELILKASIVTVDSIDKVNVELRTSANQWKTVPMIPVLSNLYQAVVPTEMIVPGILNYRMIIKKINGDHSVFPGGYNGDPYAWDYYQTDNWQTVVMKKGSPMVIFDPQTDRQKLMIYNSDWRKNVIEYVTTINPGGLALKSTINGTASPSLGWQFYFREKLNGRWDEISSATRLVVRARSDSPAVVKLGLITSEANAFSTTISLKNEWEDFELELNKFTVDSFLLLPRPYPGFLPLWFKRKDSGPMNISEVEKLEVIYKSEGNATLPSVIEIESVYLKK